jgi:cellulose biosynthesis protein BcsQ
MPRVVSFVSDKGGAGRTTTAYHRRCQLAGHHRPLGAVDTEPSGLAVAAVRLRFARELEIASRSF